MKKALLFFVLIAITGCEYNCLPIHTGIGVNLIAYQGDVVPIAYLEAKKQAVLVVERI